jgi:hypothetical protein
VPLQILGLHQPEEQRTQQRLQPHRVVDVDLRQPVLDLSQALIGDPVRLPAPGSLALDLDQTVRGQLVQLGVDLRMLRGPHRTEQLAEPPGQVVPAGGRVPTENLRGPFPGWETGSR